MVPDESSPSRTRADAAERRFVSRLVLPNGAQLSTWRQREIDALAERRKQRKHNRERRGVSWERWTIGWAPPPEVARAAGACVMSDETPVVVADRAMFPRHVRRVWFTPELLLQMMREGYRTRGRIDCEQGIPQDARLLGVSYDPSCNGVFAFVEHESFSPVHPGVEAPLLDVVFREVES